MVHYLKTDPKLFKMIRRGVKPFEIRKNDRGYQVGDTLVLRYFDRKLGLYKFDTIVAKVLSVFEAKGYGIEDGYCVMGIELTHTFDFSQIYKYVNSPILERWSPMGKMVQFSYDGFCESHAIQSFEYEADFQKVFVKNPAGWTYFIDGKSIFAKDENQLFKLKEN